MMTKNRSIVLKLILTFYYSFAVFYDTLKLIFVRPTENLCEKIFWKVTKRFVNFKTQLNHQYLSLFFQLKFKKTYLELPNLFYMKLKVKVRPTEKLHFKLGFPN